MTEYSYHAEPLSTETIRKMQEWATQGIQNVEIADRLGIDSLIVWHFLGLYSYRLPEDKCSSPE